MVKKYFMPKKICSDKITYKFFTCMYNAFEKTFYTEIKFDFSHTKIIDKSIIAPLGLLFTKIRSKQNKIWLSNVSQEIKKIFIEYGFVKIDNMSEIIDQQCMRYKTFNGDNNVLYGKYLSEQMQEIKNTEVISFLKDNIMEIFLNVKMHARIDVNRNRFGDKEVFSSGYYDEKGEYIIFSIANNGETFSENIRRLMRIEYDKEYKYIEWALSNSNSTTDGIRPGGVGLKMLKDLIIKSNGKMTICSGKGYYLIQGCERYDYSEGNDFKYKFPGTSIDIKIPISKVKENYLNINVNDFNIKDLLLKEEIL